MAKRYIAKDGHQRDTCCDEIGACAKNILTVLGLGANTIRRAYISHIKKDRSPL
jgi:hypothetical protein